MNSSNVLISFSSYMAHVINGDDELPDDIESVAFRTWELHQKITDLLCYPQYRAYENRNYSQTPEYLYCLVGHKMSVNQTAEMSVARYFELVFEYAISNKRQLAETPADKLIDLFKQHRNHKLLRRVTDKDDSKNADKKTISLWQIFEQAGQSNAGEVVMYQRWRAGSFIALCQHISDVFRTANRHYGEIFRMGLYPPDWIDSINVSQARKINKLLQPKRDANYEDTAWIEQSRQLWQQHAIKQLAGVKLNAFDDFLATELGKCLTGRAPTKPIIISDYDFSQQSNQDDDYYTPDYDIAYDSDLKIQKLLSLLEEKNLNKQDKMIILQVLQQQPLTLDTLPVRKRYLSLDLDEDSYIDYLGEVILQLLSGSDDC